MLRHRVAGPLVVTMILAAAPLVAQTTNTHCVGFDGGNPCTAMDVLPAEAILVSIDTPCSGPGSYATGTIQVHIHGTEPERYDIGIYVATDGGSVLANSDTTCYHTYLSSPFTTNLPPNPPWTADTDGDGYYEIYRAAGATTPFWEVTGGTTSQCGDIPADAGGPGNEAILEIGPVTFQCVDTDSDGAPDLEFGTSWDELQTTTCSNVGGAIPGTPAKCNASRLNLEGISLPVGLETISVQ